MKAFSELSEEEKVALFVAWLRGEVIEYRHPEYGGWSLAVQPAWLSDSSYRVKPTPIIPDTINWDHVHPDYKWMARDDNGGVYLYKKPPQYSLVGWYGASFVRARGFASYQQGNVEAKDSLVERPS